MQRAIIHVWFPHLAAERLRRWGVARAEQPVVATHTPGGVEVVASPCRLAARRGIHVGMRLTDARALCADLVSRAGDSAADEADLLHLANWARRYCPLTAPEHGETRGMGATIARDGNGLWLDVAGAAHLAGGIRALLADMAGRLRRAGLCARIAVAPTCGAAWALARYGRAVNRYACTRLSSPGPRQIAGLLGGLPLAALRLDGGVCGAMSASGLRRIGDILDMPRAPLAERFGTAVTNRLDAVLGHVNESFSPVAPQRPLVAMRGFAEAIAAPKDVRDAIDGLASTIAEDLFQQGLGARRLELGWQRVDHTLQAHEVHLSRPGQDATQFRRLLAGAAEKIDPGFGIERMWIEAHECSARSPVNAGFDDGVNAGEKRASLIDRLVARLGHGAVLYFKARASWKPETSSYMAYPDMEEPGFDERMLPKAGSVTAAPRPARLLARPHPIAVVAMLPDHPPAQFVLHRETHKVVRASGPERIAPQWWVDEAGTLTRDYFRIQDERGGTFWVYREGLPERGQKTQWFLHGFFA